MSLIHKTHTVYWDRGSGPSPWTMLDLVESAMNDATKVINGLRKDSQILNVQRETVILSYGYAGSASKYVLGAMVMVIISYDVEE